MALNRRAKRDFALNLRFFPSLILVTGVLLTAVEPTLSAFAKPSATGHSNSKVIFTPPPNDKKPKKTSGAGSRGGECRQAYSTKVSSEVSDKASAKPPLMALMPAANTGLTLAERPSFWIYVPVTSAKQAVLSLYENGSKPHSQTFFDISEAPGVISLPLPQNSPVLEIGKTYQWAVTLICGNKPNPNDPVIVSWISRIASTSATQPTDLEQAASYGRQGIWFDALTALAQARRSQPNRPELQATWTDFLESAGLAAIASEPLRP
jgi:Domain of Unknown Function (DUF928)